MPDRSQNPNLIQSVILLLLVQIKQFNPLQGVDLAVVEPLNLVHSAVSSLSYQTSQNPKSAFFELTEFAEYLKIIDHLCSEFASLEDGFFYFLKVYCWFEPFSSSS